MRDGVESAINAAVPGAARVRGRRHGAVAQSILAGTFPPEKRGQGFALFGIAVVVAPVVGPTLGGWLADNISWRWCFLINVPVGVFATTAIAMILREPEGAAAARRERRRQAGGFDAIGFGVPRRAGARTRPRP